MSRQTPPPSPNPPTVHGIDVTERTQCTHWHSDRDIIAIKHYCCGQYYACISCHEALTAAPGRHSTTATATATTTQPSTALSGHKESNDTPTPHEADVWPKSQRATPAVLCGNCKRELTVDEYLGCGNACPGCRAAFNPGCAKHYDLYFEM